MKKRILSMVLAAVITVMFTACGSANTGTTNAGSADTGSTDTSVTTPTSGASVADDSTAAGEPVTVEVWSNNRHDETYMTEMVDAFNASHSDVQINYTIMTDDWQNSIQLAYQAGTAPDVITISASDGMKLSDYVSSGMFVSLSDYIAADSTFQDVTEVYDHMYEGLNSINDDIYWAANGVRSGTRIEYNTELVAAAGYTEVPDTLEGVVQLAADVTAIGNGSTYGVGFTSSGPFGRWLEGVGEMSGYTHNGYDYTTGTYDFSSWAPLLETAAKFYENESVLPGSETQGVDNSRALFAQGSFAIWGNASQEAGVFTEQFPTTFEWGVSELPTMDGVVNGALSITPNFGFAMLSSAANKDAAWQIIEYFSSEDFLKGYFEGGYSAPLSSYMAGKIDSTKVGRLADFAIQDYEDVYPSTPSITVEGDAYPTVFWNVILGNISAEDAIADLNTRYNDALARGLQNGSCTRLVIENYDPLHPSSGTCTYLSE